MLPNYQRNEYGDIIDPTAAIEDSYYTGGESDDLYDDSIDNPYPDPDFGIDESMDGDFDSAMASIGWGNDEDYNNGDMI
jgi:hypothetical protein